MSVPIVGQTGTLGQEANVQWRRYQQSLSVFGDFNFKSSMELSGIDSEAVLQKVENHIEGDEFVGNGTKGDLLSWDYSSVGKENKNEYLFQSPKYPLFTDINFGKDHYEVKDAEGVSKDFGADWSGGKPFDIISISDGVVRMYEFLFGGLKDTNPSGSTKPTQDILDLLLSGADNISKSYEAWYRFQEVDPEQWSKPLDKNNPESVKAHNALEMMLKNQAQWMTPEIKNELSPFQQGSAEYKNKLIDILIRVFDQEGAYQK